jgi:8-oxo-dGTP pyrophosphatase MutT (NUDIX family)
MLVTSRGTGRWIIPKGWPMKRKAPYAAAAREALEEAGVVGQIGREPIGSFSHKKLLKEGGVVVCEVQVFPLEVTRGAMVLTRRNCQNRAGTDTRQNDSRSA